MGCCGGGGFGQSARSRFRRNKPQPEPGSGDQSPVQGSEAILKARLAQGQITLQEYKDLWQALHAPSMS